MLQAGRSRVRDPIRRMIFFLNLPNPSSRNRPWGFTQPLTEMSTRSREIMFLGSRARPVRKADNLTTMWANCLDNIKSLTFHNHQPRPVTGIALTSQFIAFLTPWPESTSELYRPSDRRFSATLVLTFADRGCHVVSVTNPYGRILGFLDRSRYFFFQVAPQLYSRGWVDPVPYPLLLRKSGIIYRLIV
jgi:hypothetical protein